MSSFRSGRETASTLADAVRQHVSKPRCGRFRFLARWQLKRIESPVQDVGEKSYNRPRILPGRFQLCLDLLFIPLLSALSVVKSEQDAEATSRGRLRLPAFATLSNS